MTKKHNSYDLSRKWFEFCFDNPEKVNPKHSAIYFFAIERCNRLGWKEKFGFPSADAMEIVGIKKHQTYINAFRDLVEWGFLELIQESKNQWTSNIISLVSDVPKNGKAESSEPPVCPAEKRQSKKPVPCQKTVKHRAKQKLSTPQKCSAEKGQGKGHIFKPVKTKQTSKNEIINEMKEFGWQADFDKVFENIPFEAIECYWKNSLKEKVKTLTDDPQFRGGFITNQIRANAIDFYEEFDRKQEIVGQEKQAAEEYEAIIIKGRSIWNLSTMKQKNELFDEMKSDTQLYGKLCQNTGESKNDVIMEKIYLKLQKEYAGETPAV